MQMRPITPRRGAGENAVDRRAFLTAGLAAGAGALALPAATSAARPRPVAEEARSKYEERRAGHRVTLSLAGYSFRSVLPGRNASPSMSLEDLIDFCAAQGLDGVELTSYFFPRTDAEYLLSLKRRAFLNGLTITGTPVGNNFCHPPGETRDRQLQLVRDWVDHAALLGAPCIRVFGGTKPSGASAEEARAWCVEAMKQACEYAGSKGVVLALENHGGITSTSDDVLHLIEAVDSPWFGFNLDTGNFHTRGRDPYEEMERTAPLAVVVQLKVEVSVEGKKQPTDVPRVLKILERTGFRGVLALEYEAAEDPAVAVPRHLAALKAALGR